MVQIKARISHLKLINNRRVMVYFNVLDNWGYEEEEALRVDMPIAVLAKLFGLDKEDLKKNERYPYKTYPFKETKEVIKSWLEKGSKFKKWLILK